MFQIITSDNNNFRSIREYNDNFTICHLHNFTIPVYNPPRIGYMFDIYTQDDSIDYGYEDELEYKYKTIESPAITEALNSIAENIASDYDVLLEQTDSDDVPDEMIIAVACSEVWNPQIVRYLDERFAYEEVNISCLDMYKYNGIVRKDRLVNIMKKSLGSEFIYPDDAVAFSYAVMQFLMGI